MYVYIYICVTFEFQDGKYQKQLNSKYLPMLRLKTSAQLVRILGIYE